MKKLILAMVISVFGVSSAYACDGMKGHEKSDKGDQAGTHADSKKDGKTKADTKS